MHDPIAEAADKFESKHGHLVGQFLRFAVVGVINTGLDWGILFGLSKLTGVTSGNGIIPLNIISFSVAVINSYFLHMHWSFADKEGHEEGRKFVKFLAVNLIGLFVNTVIVRFVTTDIHAMFNLSASLWLLVAKAVATAVSLIWNFIGFKLFVFKK
jgi:putative flippase GtrA